ncbi:MAG: amidohydrolase family protein [Niabella sp.]
MRFIKLQADKIFDGYRFHFNKVLITLEDGTVEGIIEQTAAGEDVKTVRGILAPGLINCHCHLELSHLKGQIPENTGLAGFVRRVVQKRNFPEATILQAIANAENEMISNGIVAVGDICNTTHTLPQKEKRQLHYHNFIEAMGFNPAVADTNFGMYLNTYQRFADTLNPAQVSIVPHAPYSVSEPLWHKILAHSNGLLSIHNQETQDENLWFENKTGGFVEMFKAMGLNTDMFTASGKSSLQTYLTKFLPTQQVLLVHNVYTSQVDIEFAASLPGPFFWCFCPNANKYISNVLPDISLFAKNNCTMVLGTDSLASNHQLSITAEIKTLQKHFPEIALEQILQWATINGARALKIDNQYGSFEKGKKPGTAIINL